MCIKHLLQKIPYIKNISYIKKHSPIIQLYECIDCKYITTNYDNYNKHCKTHKVCEVTIQRVRGRYDDLEI